MTGDSNATSSATIKPIIYTPPTGDTTVLSSYKTLTAVNYLGAGRNDPAQHLSKGPSALLAR